MNSSDTMEDYGHCCVKDKWSRGIEHAINYSNCAKASEFIHMLQSWSSYMLPATYVLISQHHACFQITQRIFSRINLRIPASRVVAVFTNVWFSKMITPTEKRGTSATQTTDYILPGLDLWTCLGH